MEEVDRELLQKYYDGRCTREEREIVETWLHSAESDETVDLPDETKIEHKERIWQNIKRDIGPSISEEKPLYIRILHYAAAACIVIGIIAAGYFSGIDLYQNERSGITAEASNQLHITAQSGKITSMHGNQFQIEFEGECMLQLHNASDSEISIQSGEKSYVLEPSQFYFLTGSDKESHVIEKKTLPFGLMVQFERELKGNFSIYNS